MTKDQRIPGINPSGTDRDKKSEVLFPDEIQHLELVLSKLEAALRKADSDLNRLDGEYVSFQHYMAESRAEIDPHEMFQNQLALKRMDSTGAFAFGIRNKTAKLRSSPYFARIDFRRADATESIPYYIGLFSFSDEEGMLIYDWRAPIASMFYDYEIGWAGYDAPKGRMEGELTRKRQYRIRNGKLEYTLESSSGIQDEVLRQELSRTSDEKMKSIIATIQKEQNQIIRNEKADVLIIQGVAGSGKTSIALHRIAYLLYRLNDRLSAKNVAILSPNRVWGDYISNVLPELGEEPIYEVSFADLANMQLEGVIGFDEEQDPIDVNDAAWAERVRFKSTLSFVRKMESFIARLPEMVFIPADYSYGRFSITADMIGTRFLAYRGVPVQQRLQMLADEIEDRFATENYMGEEIPSSRTILKDLRKMIKATSTLSLYQVFYRVIGRPDMLVLPAKKRLEWADVFPFLYLHAAYEGLKPSNRIRHLVIDEMQDYTPIQYAVINLLFKCPKTILGDFGQLIHPYLMHSLDDIRQLYEGAEVVKLIKSYRSTFEIISFARTIKHQGTMDTVERHGETPMVISCKNEDEKYSSIRREVSAFCESATGSLGIIAKTSRDAEYIYNMLSAEFEVHLLSTESTRFSSGVSITSVRMSKGLEFDAVLIPDVSKAAYSAQQDRSLLYIACTRAMHRLILFYTGELSPLLGTSVSGEEVGGSKFAFSNIPPTLPPVDPTPAPADV